MIQLGKRYRCTNCETTVVCLRPAEAAIWRCCGKELEVLPVAPLPSSD